MVTRDQGGGEVVSGLTNLVVLKTTDSAFAGFPRDEVHHAAGHQRSDYGDRGRRFCGTIGRRTDYAARERIRTALVDTFAAHMSQSVNIPWYAMGEAALAACADATEITLTLPNRHHLRALT